MTFIRVSVPIAPDQRRGDVVSYRLRLNNPFPAVVELAGHANRYGVRAGRSRTGPVLLGLSVEPLAEGGVISAEDLKAVPVQRLAAAVVQHGDFHPDDDELGGADLHTGQERAADERMEALEAKRPRTPAEEAELGQLIDEDNDRKLGVWARPEPADRGRRKAYGDDHYREVAKVAQVARADGRAARRAIAEKYNVVPATADKWMRGARARGLLDRHPSGPPSRAVSVEP